MELLNRNRSGSRGWLSRSSKALDELTQKDNVTDVELTNALSDFHARLSKLDDVQGQLETVVEVAALEDCIQEAFDYRQRHIAIRDRAEKRLQEMREKKDIAISDNASCVSLRNVNPLSQARLPKLDMPKFSGDYLEFTSFFDKFVAIVDGSDLPAVTKFTYLQSLLTGEALASIKGLSVTEESYPVAKEILVQRFGRKERIIFAHIQKLLSLRVDFRKSNGLWSLYDCLQTNVRCLETLGVTGDTYGVILTPLILSRIPTDIRMEWAREGEGRESDLGFLLDFLYKEIKRRERSQTFQMQEEGRKDKHASLPSVAAFHAGAVKRQCAFCSKTNHNTTDCFGIKKCSQTELLSKCQENALCFICFGKHFAKKCNSSRKCERCGGRHHPLLCKKRSEVTNDLKPTDGDAQVTYTKLENKNKTTLMQVVKTTLQSPTGQSAEVNVLFDGGSDRSFVTDDIATKLNLKRCNQESFAFSGFGGVASSPRTRRNIYKASLGGVGVELAGISTICADMYRAPVPSHVLNKFGMHFTEDYSQGRSVSVDLLIGLDCYWNLVTCETKQVDSLVAQRTVCGWMLSGVYGGDKQSDGLQLLCIDAIPETLLRSMWELDSIGIHDTHQSVTHDKVMETFSESVTKVNGRYRVGLPWKEHVKGKLLDNRGMAEKRLKSLSKRLAVKPDLKDRYDQNIREMEVAGIISEVDERDKNTGPVFYMPHRPVVKEGSATTKVRPVFDASAKGLNGISLNDCLETGPNLLPNLVEILLRFRRWKVAVTSDVTKAFLQVKVKDEDKNVLRFLWDDGGVVRTMMFDRVPFGTKASPFLLNATIKCHLRQYTDNYAVCELKDNLYVDDFLSGADTEEDACRLVTDAKKIMSEAGMDLTKWSSNSTQVADKVMKEFDSVFGVGNPTKVLGLKWMPHDDCFSFNGINVPDDLVITKRVVLSFIARLFDPLGFITPYAITAKLLFQELWELGIDWDSIIPIPLQQKFEKWLGEIKYLPEWTIPRCFIVSSWRNAGDIALHVFCDASEKAYGCCIYLLERQGAETKTSLIMSKAKVAPLKRVTLPRLELLAAVLGARMKQFVQTALHLSEQVAYKCYTDSMITLKWIQSNSNRWKTFVANRVQEIQDLTNPACWNHCAGVENPADLLTRGVSSKQLSGSSLWLCGPEWLSNEVIPQIEETCIDLNETITGEERVSIQCASIDDQTKRSILKMDSFSSIHKATRVMGWILRFVDRCSQRRRDNCPYLTNEELIRALHKLTHMTQSAFFPNELRSLKEDKTLHKSSSLRKLQPFLDENGLMRATCRLNYSDLSYDEKYPVILPKCHFSLLLIREAHLSSKHAGVNQMISNLRNRYWIIGLRSMARKVKGQCLACKVMDAKACQEPIAPLMEARLKRAPPFSVVGVDHAGPVYCKDFHRKKFYILLFTCATIRAVHLELVDSLSLPNFMLAFRRFVGRRGIPSTIFSDNAQTFRGASAQLFKVYGPNVPVWKFSVPRAPWWGGWWERMIKNVKSALKKTIGTKCLDKVEFETTLTEVEACINSRPLTFVGDDIENGHPLSPSHFLLGRGSHLSKEIQENTLPQGIDADSLKGSIQMVDARLEMFWNRWQSEYLKQLPMPERRQKVGRVDIGSVVLIREDNCPRLHWPIGVIEELIEGRDGISRTVKVKTKTGSFTRPIQRIHNLELNFAFTPEISDPTSTTDCNGIGERRSRFGRTLKIPNRL